MIRIILQNLLSYLLLHLQRKNEEKDKASKANAQHSTEYYRVRMRIILILCFVYMSILMETKSTKSIVNHE